MIDFNKDGFFARLKKVRNDEFEKVLKEILIEEEVIVSTYQSVRDGVVFTNKRIISINVQGITGAKKDFTSFPYSKIQFFSVETAGTMDLDSELEIFLAGGNNIKFEFFGSNNIQEIGKMIGEFIL